VKHDELFLAASLHTQSLNITVVLKPVFLFENKFVSQCQTVISVLQFYLLRITVYEKTTDAFAALLIYDLNGINEFGLAIISL